VGAGDDCIDWAGADWFGDADDVAFEGVDVFADGDAAGCDDCAAAPYAVVRAKTVGRMTREFRRNEKDLKLLTPRNAKASVHARLKG
jgi:hypothetical protein